MPVVSKPTCCGLAKKDRISESFENTVWHLDGKALNKSEKYKILEEQFGIIRLYD